jgi:hypothetical protein
VPGVGINRAGASRKVGRTNNERDVIRHRILVVAEDVTLRSTLARWLIAVAYSVELAVGERRASEVSYSARR